MNAAHADLHAALSILREIKPEAVVLAGGFQEEVAILQTRSRWPNTVRVIAAVAAVTRIKPKGTRPVAHSRMMAMGRLALLAIVVILVYVAFRARF